MKKDRHLEVLSHLSFAAAGASTLRHCYLLGSPVHLLLLSSSTARYSRGYYITTSHTHTAGDVTEYAPNKLAKLKRVNDLLRKNCERAWDVEPDATLDESRLRLHSRFCSFVTEMICKPIKTGCHLLRQLLEERVSLHLGMVHGHHARPPTGPANRSGAD